MQDEEPSGSHDRLQAYPKSQPDTVSLRWKFRHLPPKGKRLSGRPRAEERVPISSCEEVSKATCHEEPNRDGEMEAQLGFLAVYQTLAGLSVQLPSTLNITKLGLEENGVG